MDTEINLKDMIRKISIDKYSIIFGILFLFFTGVGIFLNSSITYSNFILNKEIKEKKEKEELLSQMRIKLHTEKTATKLSQEESKSFKDIFYTQNEKDYFVEYLNGLISKNNLTMLNIIKADVKTVTDSFLYPDKKEEELTDSINIFSEGKISISITGDFIDYLKFKKEMSSNKKIVIIEEEKLTTPKEDGNIVSSLNIKIYGLLENLDLNTKE